jgi:hypothetical protein
VSVEGRVRIEFSEGRDPDVIPLRARHDDGGGGTGHGGEELAVD